MFRTSSSVIRRSLNLAASSTRSVGIKAAPVNSFKLNRSAINQTSIRWSSTDPIGDVKEPKVAETVVDDLGDVIPNVITDADKILGLEKEIRDLKDRVVRSLAEEENVRRIAKRDVENARAYAVSGFAKSLLEVGDDFERAIQAAPQKGVAVADAEAALKTLVEGITMTEKSLQKSFLQHGVIKYGTVGDVFDPSLHDALFSVPDASKTSGTISQVLKNGYKLKDRVLRPAQVGTVA